MGEGGDGGRVLRPRGRGRAGSPWACREGVLRPPHRQLPLLSSCQFSILSCAGKGGQCARPRMKAKPPPGLSAGGRTGLWLKNQRPKSQRGPAQHQDGGTVLPPRSQSPPAPYAQPLGQGEAASPCQTPPGVGFEAPKMLGAPAGPMDWEKRGLQKCEQEAAACRSHHAPHVQK